VEFQNMLLILGMGCGHKNLKVDTKFTDDKMVEDCPGFPHRYNLRGSDNDFGSPASIETGRVEVNFVGRAFTAVALPIPQPEGYLPVRAWWLSD